MDQDRKIIAFQGEHGAYSDLACRTMFKEYETLPCTSFDEAFDAVHSCRAKYAMIPIDNTIAGRVADVHTLLPKYDLFIIGEHFQPIHHNLLGVKNSKISDIQYIHSHIHALPQCKKEISNLGVQPKVHADTAGAAAEIARLNNPAHGAIASSLAAEIYGLDILKSDIQDESGNMTRFIVLSREKDIPPIDVPVLSSILFEVRNIPAALYKAMGGFATNGLSMTKLESYVGKGFEVAQFYCEVLGHPNSEAFKNAYEELEFYAKTVRFVGAFPVHPSRMKG